MTLICMREASLAIAHDLVLAYGILASRESQKFQPARGNLRKWQYRQVTPKMEKTFRHPVYQHDRADSDFDKGTFEITGF